MILKARRGRGGSGGGGNEGASRSKHKEMTKSTVRFCACVYFVLHFIFGLRLAWTHAGRVYSIYFCSSCVN